MVNWLICALAFGKGAWDQSVHELVYGKGGCQGDSGGPLIIPGSSSDAADDTAVIFGIVSFGGKCGDFPTVFSRVSKFLPWIQNFL